MTAGSYDLYDRNTVPTTTLVEGGTYGEVGRFTAGSPGLGAGHLLYGLEYFHDNRLFRRPDNYRRYNGVLRWSSTTADAGLNVTVQSYSGRWNSTDQIPLRGALVEESLAEVTAQLERWIVRGLPF